MDITNRFNISAKARREGPWDNGDEVTLMVPIRQRCCSTPGLIRPPAECPTESPTATQETSSQPYLFCVWGSVVLENSAAPLSNSRDICNKTDDRSRETYTLRHVLITVS